MIEIRHLRKEYETVTPLMDVNTTINEGDVISVIGPSGTGKSTLLRCINMMEKPTSGEIIIDGENIMDEDVNIDKIRMKVGMVFQSFNLYGHLTVLENIMLAQTVLLKRTRQQAYDKAMETLGQVGLKDKALQYPDQLSGGQKQRAAIARTLAMDPEIILFDEPTSALDPRMTFEVLRVVEHLAKTGKTMMVVTHSLDFARKISNRVFYMDEGGIYEDGPPEQIFNNPQRDKTRDFIKGSNSLTIEMLYGQEDISESAIKIYKYGANLRFTHRVIFAMQLLFEEVMTSYFFRDWKPGNFIRATFEYEPIFDTMRLVVSHNIKELGKWDTNSINYKLVSMTIRKYTWDEETDENGIRKTTFTLWEDGSTI